MPTYRTSLVAHGISHQYSYYTPLGAAVDGLQESLRAKGLYEAEHVMRDFFARTQFQTEDEWYSVAL